MSKKRHPAFSCSPEEKIGHGNEERFPPTRLSADDRFRNETIA
jgi:hypothetical protein